MNHPSSLNERDKQCIWHPFTQHGIEKDFLPVKSAQGAWITLDDDRNILDAISSWWANLHGHAHPDIVNAISTQAQQFSHVMFAGFTHEPGVALAEILVQAVQEKGTKLSRCFYAGDGATAIEAAMKMAYQYHQILGNRNRTRFLSFTHGYHGDTLGSMALSARDSYHHYFAALLPDVDFVSDIASLQNALNQYPDNYAAFIIEPMIQGAAGMLIHSPQFLAEAAAICKQASVLFICDEVFTGFYRTGKCFAFEHANIQPDLLCLGKGLTGGFLPLSVTLATEDIFAAYRSEKPSDAFLHGHTFTGNALGCAAALASWKLLHQPSTQAAIKRISDQTKLWLSRLSEHENSENARSLGTIGAIDIKNFPKIFSRLTYSIRCFAIKNNVLLRPIGSTLYAVPPYCATESDIDKIYATIQLILENMETLK